MRVEWFLLRPREEFMASSALHHFIPMTLAAAEADVDTGPVITSFDDAWQLIVAKVTGWGEVLVDLIPNAILAILVMVIGVVLASYIARGARRLGLQFTDSKSIVELSASIIKVLIIAAVLFVALSILNLEKTVTSLLAGVGILGLALGFAFQDLASNFLAGFMMGIQHPFNIGDIIKSNDYMGTVVRLNMRNTVIENFSGQTIIVPNKTIFQNPLINYNTRGKRRLTVDVGVAYDSDLELVEKTLRESVQDIDWKHPDHPIDVWCRGFGESSVNWQVFVWVEQPGEPGYFAALDILHRRVFAALKKANITIPFPNRTLSWTGPFPKVDVTQNQESTLAENETDAATRDSKEPGEPR